MGRAYYCQLIMIPVGPRDKHVINEPVHEFVCLFDLILYVHSTLFQLCGTGLPGLNQY